MKFLAAGLLWIALVTIQVLIGGTRLLYCVPSASLLALAAMTAASPGWAASKTARSGCIACISFFAAYLLLRNRLSPIDYLSRPDFFTITGSLIVYLLVSLFLIRSKLRLWVVSGMLTLALAHAAIGAIQFKRGDDFMLLPWFQRTASVWRASGFYISPNHYAGVLEVMALIAISITFWGTMRPGLRILTGYAAGCCVAGLAISGSRGGYLGFGAGFCALVTLSLVTLRKAAPTRFWRTTLVTITALSLLTVIAALLVSQSSGLRARMAHIDDPQNPRWLLWNAALRQFQLSPIFGTGSGTYLYYGRMFRDPIIQNDPIFVHNDYLHLLAEYGLMGAALFVLFFASHIAAGLRNVRMLARGQIAQPNQLALQLGALSAIMAYVVHSVVDFNLHIPANAFLLALVFGIVANPGLPVRHETKLGQLTRMLARIELVLLGLVVLAYGLPKLPGEWYAEKARVTLRDYQLDTAHDYAKKALEHELHNPDIYYYAGEASREMSLQKMGPREELSADAVNMFKQGLVQFPQDVRIVLKLAQTYDEIGQYPLADEQLSRAAELDPEASLLQAYYGMHFQKQGLLEQAEERYDAALQLDGRNQIARSGLESVRKALAPLRSNIPPAAPASEPREEIDDSNTVIPVPAAPVLR